MLGESCPRREQVRNGFIEGLRVLEEFLCCGLESREPPGVVIELRIRRFFPQKGRKSAAVRKMTPMTARLCVTF